MKKVVKKLLSEGHPHLATLRSICQHSGDMAALDALAKVETNQGYRSDLVSNTKEVKTESRGDTTGYAMRRLAKDVPAIHLARAHD